MQLLCAYSWPGNVRELECRIEELVFSDDDQPTITAQTVSVLLQSRSRVKRAQAIKIMPTNGMRIAMAKDGTMDMLEGETLKDWLVRMNDVGLDTTSRSYPSRREAAERLGMTLSALKKALQKMRIRDGRERTDAVLARSSETRSS